MKRILVLICALMFGAAASHAQADRRSVEALDIKLTRSDNDVTIGFLLNVGSKATRASYNLVIDPVIRNGEAERKLPSIVIRGRRSKVTDLRHELSTGERSYDPQPAYMTPGQAIEYVATVPYEEWMRGGELFLDGVSVGCCSAKEANVGSIAQNILYAEPEIETRVVEVPVVAPRKSTGDQLAEQFPFVASATEASRAGVADFLTSEGKPARELTDTERESSVAVHFRLNNRIVDRTFGDNNRNLVELVSVVRALSEADDVRITDIVIAGFTSPEGSLALNERLAGDRAVAVKKFLTDNTDADPAMVRIYNGGVDWDGLRRLTVESDLDSKQRIVNIIDGTPVWDASRRIGRRGELMRLDGGVPYRRMEREIFPKLRQAAFIKVYYENIIEEEQQ